MIKPCLFRVDGVLVKFSKSTLALMLAAGLAMMGGMAHAAQVPIQSLIVTGTPARLELLYDGPSRWEPTLEQSTENAHQTTIRLGLAQASLPPSVLRGFLDNRPQWLSALQESYPGIYYLQTDTGRDGRLSLVFKSTSPYRASLCGVARGQVGVCFQSPTTAGMALSKPSRAAANPSPALSSTTTRPPETAPTEETLSPTSATASGEAPVAQARSAFLQARLPQARQLLEAYFADHLEPGAEAQFLYAQVLIGLDQVQAAIAPLSLIELQHPQAGLLKASLQIRQGQLDTASRTLAGVREQFGTSATWQYEMGLLSQAQQRLTEAAGFYRSALAERPDWSDPWFHLAQVMVFQKNWPAALASLNQLLLLRPDDIQALKLKAFVYQNQQRLNEALTVYRQAFNADLFYNYAVLAKGQKQYATAKTMALAAHSLAGDNPSLLFNLGLLLADLGEKPMARNSLFRYVTLVGNAPAEASRVVRAKSTLARIK